MTIDDKASGAPAGALLCLYKPTLTDWTAGENPYKCYGCIWIEYGCPDYEPKKERYIQLDLFRRIKYKDD